MLALKNLLALKDAIRLASRVSDANPPMIRSEAEISDDERKYLNNVLDKTRIPENISNADRAAIQEKIRTDVVDMVKKKQLIHLP